MTQPDSRDPDSFDARDGSGDPTTDPAAAGESSVEHPDGDGGAVPREPEVPEPGTGS